MRSIVVSIPLCLSLSSFALAQETGLIFADDAAYRSIPLATTPLLGTVPEEADLSQNFPAPGNQGKQSSCVGWAVAYALKGYQERVERNWNQNSSENHFSPAYIYNQIKQGPGCMGGSLFVDAFNVLRRDGVLTNSSFPYDEANCTTQPSNAQKQQARQFAIAEWRRVNVQDEIEVKTQIAAGFPVVIGMMVDRKFVDLSGNTVYSDPTGPKLGGHAVVVVGYSDSKQAFKLINSWGAGWAENGFGWVTYPTFRNVVREGYVAQDIVVNAPPLTPPQPVSPQPPPPVIAPTVSLGLPAILHNVQVATPAGAIYPGMTVTVPGKVENASGRTAQIVVKFNYLNGPPLRANQQEPYYRDVSGFVATGTQPTTVGSGSEDLSHIAINIPYYALNFAPTNGVALLSLSLTAMAFIDNVQVAQSAPVPFTVRY